MRSAKKAQTQQNKPRKNVKNISDYEIQFNYVTKGAVTTNMKISLFATNLNEFQNKII